MPGQETGRRKTREEGGIALPQRRAADLRAFDVEHNRGVTFSGGAQSRLALPGYHRTIDGNEHDTGAAALGNV